MTPESVFRDLPTLRTARLVLRKLREDDDRALFAYASDPEVARYTAWEAHRSIEDSRAFLANIATRYAVGAPGTWGVTLAASGELIGTCGFARFSEEHARGEIGYAFARAHWGRGIATEAVREVLAYSFRAMSLNKIVARCFAANLASARVMEKCGMMPEGLLRRHVQLKGTFHDLKLYGSLNHEHRAMTDRSAMF